MAETTVHRLVGANDLETLRGFLKSIGDSKSAVNEVDDEGRSPLYRAVSSGASAAIVELLLQEGADPHFVSVTNYGVMPQGCEDFEIAGPEVGEFFSVRIQRFLSELDCPPELPPHEGSDSPSEGFAISVLTVALQGEDLEVVKLLRKYGADLAYKDEDGSTAVFDAVHGPGDRPAFVRYLIDLGLELDVEHHHGGTPLFAAYSIGNHEVVKLLLEAGVDEAQLGWTDLIRAVAIGTPKQVEDELAREGELEATDVLGHTALQVAIERGDLAICKMLHRHGAVATSELNLHMALDAGHSHLLEWLVGCGCDMEHQDEIGRTVLDQAASQGDLEAVKTLLRLGADPNPKSPYGSLFIDAANDSELLHTLLDHGTDPARLTKEAKRVLLGFDDEPDWEVLSTVTRPQYLEARCPREGTANPEDISHPFRLAMIRAGVNAYAPREHFHDEFSFSEPTKTGTQGPVWCADRFGQTLTFLPDGRKILIAGEHEDSYDPDFCIYNDVFVFEPDGEIRIYGYPFSVFPPTDFHTATLVGEWIYIIGSLGYTEDRTNASCVYRLSTADYHIEHVATTGRGPGRIYGHRATLVGEDSILVQGGKIVTFAGSEEEHTDNHKAFTLDLRTLRWTQS